MGSVVVEMSPSVDGYVAGLGVSIGAPFGTAGERLHRWLGFGGATPDPADRAAAGRVFDGAGAVVIGRRMFDVGIGPWGADGAFGMPVYVVTNRPADVLVKGPTTFTFVTEGAATAVELARAAAGERDVVVNGGADVVQQCLAAGLVDEVRLHVVPVLLGGGTRLFERPLAEQVELEQVGAEVGLHATHLTYRAGGGH